jgi:hypothetical protein
MKNIGQFVSMMAVEATTEQQITFPSVVKSLQAMGVKLPHSLTEAEVASGHIIQKNLRELINIFQKMEKEIRYSREIEKKIDTSKEVVVTPGSVVLDGKPLKATWGMYELKENVINHALTGVVQTAILVTSKTTLSVVTRASDTYSNTCIVPEIIYDYAKDYIKASVTGDILSARYAMVSAAKKMHPPDPMIIPMTLLNMYSPGNSYVDQAFVPPDENIKRLVEKVAPGTKFKKRFKVIDPPKVASLTRVDDLYAFLTNINMIVGLRKGKLHALCYPMYIGEIPSRFQVAVTEVMTIMTVMKNCIQNPEGVQLVGYAETIASLVSEVMPVYKSLHSQDVPKTGFTGTRMPIIFIRTAALVCVPPKKAHVYDKSAILKTLDTIISGLKKYTHYFIEVILMPELFAKYKVLRHPQAHLGVVYVIGLKNPEIEVSDSPSPKYIESDQGDTERALLNYCFRGLMWYIYFPYHRKVLWEREPCMTMVPVYLPVKKKDRDILRSIDSFFDPQEVVHEPDELNADLLDSYMNALNAVTPARKHIDNEGISGLEALVRFSGGQTRDKEEKDIDEGKEDQEVFEYPEAAGESIADGFAGDFEEEESFNNKATGTGISSVFTMLPPKK